MSKISYYFVLLLSILIAGCISLPQMPHLPKSKNLTQKSLSYRDNIQDNPLQNHLATAIGEQATRHPNLSGYYPISTGSNAFATRSILSDMSNHTIDAQYYIWHNDEAGQLMLKDLWIAAERGVTVRLLLDDFNSSKKMDKLLANFASHPNIAVRIANPATFRSFRPINFISNPIRTNTRMHNKSMTFDNHISIIGGRNIGNEYLNNADDNHFADLDVMLVGEVVDKISTSFDEYWDSPYAYDIETLIDPYPHDFLTSLTLVNTQNKLNASQEQQTLKTYRDTLKTSTIGQDLLDKKIAFRWARIDFLADNASKLRPISDTSGHLVNKMQNHFGTPKNKLTIISSYFVPTKEGVEGLIKLAKNGIKVQILTNSYDATDVGAVHSGYAHWRRVMLASGIDIYELKSTARPNAADNNKLWRTKNQTTTSLHAKTFAVDDQMVFIGSYNVDPRSANINTELGVIIHDDKLAAHMHNAFSDNMPNQAYKVVLKDDQLQWHTIEHGQKVILNTEPNMSLSNKISIGMLSKLPIDWLL